jgi:hypothetical protein
MAKRKFGYMAKSLLARLDHRIEFRSLLTHPPSMGKEPVLSPFDGGELEWV